MIINNCLCSQFYILLYCLFNLRIGAYLLFLTRLGYVIIYFLDLIYEILKDSFDVAFNGIMRQNIDPVVVEIETVLERPVSQTILANSISLTPGTLSVDLDSENNIIKVAAISPRSKEDIIPFEPYIKKMLE